MIFSIFLGFSCFQPRASEAVAPKMDDVMHQNDHLVNPYHFQKKKIIFVTMATIKLYIFDDFLYFLGFSCFHPRGSGREPPTWIM